MTDAESSLWQQIANGKKNAIISSITNFSSTIVIIIAGLGVIATGYKYLSEEFSSEPVTIEIRLIGSEIAEGDQISIYPLKRIEEISAEKHVSLVENFENLKGQNIKIRLISKNAPVRDLTSFYVGKEKNKILIICHQQEPGTKYVEPTLQQ